MRGPLRLAGLNHEDDRRSVVNQICPCSVSRPLTDSAQLTHCPWKPTTGCQRWHQPSRRRSRARLGPGPVHDAEVDGPPSELQPECPRPGSGTGPGRRSRSSASAVHGNLQPRAFNCSRTGVRPRWFKSATQSLICHLMSLTVMSPPLSSASTHGVSKDKGGVNE